MEIMNHSKNNFSYEVLNQLGDSSDKIYNFFFKENIKGKRNDNFSCPLAVYLKTTYNFQYVSVNNKSVHVSDSLNEPWWGSTVRLPVALKQFISLFDEGNFPAIEQ